jgi:septum formation protein
MEMDEPRFSPFVLGSASPRRREILSQLGLSFRVIPGDVDESRRAEERPEDYLSRIARAKLADVAARPGSEGAPGIVVADTIVVLPGEAGTADILGKPVDEADSERLLRRIVGRTHVVFTRYAISVSPALAEPVVERTVSTVVTMRAATDGEIRRYVGTGEGLDKAGAYAAQGIGAFLVERIDGSFSNVVGLPACEVVSDLVRAGVIGEFPRTGR